MTPRFKATGTVLRVVLSLVLGYAGLLKVLDLAGTGRTVALYQIVPPAAAQMLGGMLTLVELALAVLLLAGLATRLTAAAVALMMLVYILAIASLWARGLSIDCGCFAVGGVVSSGAVRGYVIDIARDLVLLGAAARLVVRPQTFWSLDTMFAGEQEHSYEH